MSINQRTNKLIQGYNKFYIAKKSLKENSMSQQEHTSKA